MFLDATTRSIQIVLTAAKTTTDMPVLVNYVDITATTTTPGLHTGTTNGVTPATCVPAPAASTQRNVNGISVSNIDTAAKTVQVSVNDNGTLYQILSLTLQVGYSLLYTDTEGWRVVDLNGAVVVSFNSILNTANIWTADQNFASTTVEVAPATLSTQAVQSGQAPTIGWGGTSTGSANAQVISPAIPVLAYAAGQKFQFKAGYTNSGATTLAVSALGTVAVQINGNALVGGEIITGKTYTVLLDSTSTAQLQFFSETYIEGTWAPNQGSGLTVVGASPAFSSSGSYTKVGRVVTLNGQVNGATSVALGVNGIICSNLPFAAQATFYSFGLESNSAGNVQAQCIAQQASTILADNGLGIAATTSIYFSITYMAAY